MRSSIKPLLQKEQRYEESDFTNILNGFLRDLMIRHGEPVKKKIQQVDQS